MVGHVCCRLLLQLSEIQQQHLQQSPASSSVWLSAQDSLPEQVGRLAISFVVATAQVEAAADLLQVIGTLKTLNTKP